uniref:Putative conserved plasma membrane protein n=1 Tax=Anopheles triannulatus TaxID=58253 RepID=A0A2M4AU23_9DIPT
MHYLRTLACGFARTSASSTGLSSRSAARSFCSKIEPKPSPKPTAAAGTSATGNGSTISGHTHAPNNLEKRMLVFTKRYKSIDEVPNFVSQEKMERVRNQVRIKVANYMMIATAIGCIIMVISGKKAQERGESVSQMNLDWHKEYNEKARAEYEASQAAGAKK